MNRLWKALLITLMMAVPGAPMHTLARDPLNVVATVGMVGDIVQRIGGNRVTVTTLAGEGVDPHLYKTTRSDVARLMQADAVFYVGFMLEGKMSSVLDRLRLGGKPVLAVAEAVPSDRLLADGEGGHHDPHLWMDVAIWSQIAHPIAERLALLDPEGAADFRARAAAWTEAMLTFDREIRSALANIPREQRVMMTAHDAFRYFGRAYDVEVLAIQGLSTESEAGLHDINRLVNVLVNRQIEAIFVETSVADKNVRALIEGARARGHTVRIGGELFSDAMGAAGTPEGTYPGMIAHNVNTLLKALGEPGMTVTPPPAWTAAKDAPP